MDSQLYEYRIVKIHDNDYIVQSRPVYKWEYIGSFQSQFHAEQYLVELI